MHRTAGMCLFDVTADERRLRLSFWRFTQMFYPSLLCAWRRSPPRKASKVSELSWIIWMWSVLENCTSGVTSEGTSLRIEFFLKNLTIGGFLHFPYSCLGNNKEQKQIIQWVINLIREINLLE
jgi:hypothetical protein